MYITACHPVSLLRRSFIGLIQAICLNGETAYRNPYTIPKTTTPVKKIVPFSALSHLLLTITAPKQGGKRGQKQ
jgi:hypothetical protein